MYDPQRKTGWLQADNVRFVLIGCLYFVCLLVANEFFLSRFETNDDASMMSMAAGFMGAAPTQYLYMTHVIVGKVLVWVYQQFGTDSNWYAIYLDIIYLMGWLWLTWFMRQQRYWIVLLPIIFYFSLRCFILPQVTTAAATIGIAGLFPLLLNRHKQICKTEVFVGWLFFVLCFLVRREVFVLLMALGGSAWLALGVKYWHRGALVLLPAIVLCIGLYAFEKNIVQDEWEEFYNEVTTLSESCDTPRKSYMGKVAGKPGIIYSRGALTAYEKLGWEQEELQLARFWTFLDYNVFTPENFEILKNNLPFFPEVNPFSRACKWLVQYKHLSFFYLTIPIFAFILLGKPLGIRYLFVYGCSVSLILFLAYVWRMPVRVFFSINLFMYLIMLSYTGECRKTRLVSLITFLAAIIFVGYGLYLFNGIKQTNEEGYEQAKIVFSGINQFDQNNDKVFIPAVLLPTTYLYRTDISSSIDNVRLMRSGWGYRNPGNKEHLDYLNQDNPLSALWESENAFLVSSDYMNKLISKYTLKRYNINLAFTKLVDFKERTKHLSRPSIIGIYKVHIEPDISPL